MTDAKPITEKTAIDIVSYEIEHDFPKLDYIGEFKMSAEQYGISVMKRPVEIKYGRTWWQFLKPWKLKTMTTIEMQRELNERMTACLKNL